MTNNKQPQIFLSYAWANVTFANEVYNDFKGTGIIFQRDVRDALHTGSIKDLMARAGNSDAVVLLVSDEFMRCANCMYEITELLNAPAFENRILPVLLNNTLITEGKEQEKYYYHWQEQVEEAKRIYAAYGGETALADCARMQGIYADLGNFFHILEKHEIVPYKALKLRNYAQVIGKMDFPQKHSLTEILEISKIADKKAHDSELIYVRAKYTGHHTILFYSAYNAQERLEYDRARQYYEALLALYPTSAAGKCYYAHLLKTYFDEYDTAKELYEEALAINPYFAEAHHCYAIFLAKQFSLYDDAKAHYETAIKLNPQNAEVYNNYALLLAKHYERYDEARAYLEMATEIDHKYANAHNNLACLLETHFKDYEQAKVHYEEAIKLSRQHDLARTNLAILIKNHFS